MLYGAVHMVWVTVDVPPAPDGALLPARWVLAAVAERRGAWAEARDQFRTILARIAPDHPNAATVRARLDAAEQALRDAGAR